MSPGGVNADLSRDFSTFEGATSNFTIRTLPVAKTFPYGSVGAGWGGLRIPGSCSDADRSLFGPCHYGFAVLIFHTVTTRACYKAIG